MSRRAPPWKCWAGTRPTARAACSPATSTAPTTAGRLAETLMDQGADVIMPVAGPVGLGSAAAIQERGNAWMIGVDTDRRQRARVRRHHARPAC